MGSVNFVKLKRKNYYSFIIIKNALNAIFFEKKLQKFNKHGKGERGGKHLGWQRKMKL